ncbi:MAG: DNRLRE domain-containing protein, partial [Planctomycetota bacterium]
YLSAAEASTNNAAASGLWVDGDASDVTGSQPRQALVRFDVIVGGTGIPAGAVIESATLGLRTSTTPQSHSADPMTLSRMLAPWSDTSTWTSLGSGVSTDGVEAILGGNATFVPSVNGGALAFDVTESVYAWQSGAPNRGWAFTPGGTDGWRIESAEAATVGNRPALTVTYVVRAASGEVVVDVSAGSRTQAAAGCPEVVGGVTVRKRGGGDVVFDAANSHTGRTIVEQGRLVITRETTLRSSTLAALAGGTVSVADGVQATVAGLDLDAGGTIDLGGGTLVVSRGLQPGDVGEAIRAGRGDGGWNGPRGLTSAVAAAAVTAGMPRAVGAFFSDDGSTTLACAAPGDTNLDRLVDILDAAALVAGGRFNAGLPGRWQDGDFYADGLVDILDVASFVSTGLFNAGAYDPAGAVTAVAAVPEPGTGVAVAVGLLSVGLVLRRGGIFSN